MDDDLFHFEPAIEEDLEPDDNELFDDEDPEELPLKAPPVAVQTTQSLKRCLANISNEEIATRCRRIIRHMVEQGLDLTLFLFYISWTIQEAIDDPVIRYARTALMCSEELSIILKNWHRPPRKCDRGIRTRAAGATMDALAEDIVSRRVNREMRNMGPLMTSSHSDFSEEALLSVKLDQMVPAMKAVAPTFWALCRAAAFTPRQATKNTKKSDPDTVY